MSELSQVSRGCSTGTRCVLDAITFGVAVIGPDGTVLATNPAWERFIDAAGPELAGARAGGNYLQVLHQQVDSGNPFAAEGLEAVESVIRGERVLASLEHAVRVAGGVRWFLSRATPLAENCGRIVVTHIDITPRVMTHLALEDAHARLREMSARLIAVEEEERRAIGLDLHDDVGQSLTAVAMGLARLENLVVPEHRELTRECSRVLAESLEKLRVLVGELRSPELSEGLGHALDALVRRVRETTGVRVEVDVRGLETARPDRALELTCYRVVQEALNNAIRHARATEIALRVEADERLIKLRVRDNGVGFEARTARRAGSRRSGVGLNGMVERTRLAGGRLKVRSVPGTGTNVTAIFPLIVTRS